MPHILINLDPSHPYAECDINIREFIMSERLDGLGPNGAIVKAMQEINNHLEWLTSKLSFHIEELELPTDEDIVVFIIMDFPGQVELYMHHQSTRKILEKLEKLMRIVVINVNDSTYLPDMHHYIAMSLTSLGSMLNVGCSTLNVLSKMDLLDTSMLNGKLSDYLYPTDVSAMIPNDIGKDSVFFKFQKLTSEIAEIISNYSILSYIPYSINSPLSIQKIVKHIIKVSGVDGLFSNDFFVHTEVEDDSERWEHKEIYNQWEEDKMAAYLDKDQLEAWKNQKTIKEGTVYDPKIFDGK